ncbi:MAG: NfeD family protein [Rhodospirillaceae bacterium]
MLAFQDTGFVMDISTVWLGASLLICLAELALPGQVAIGIGLSGLLVTLLLWFGILDTWPVAALASLVGSIPIILMARAFFSWMMPGDTAVHSTDEDGALEGRRVKVVETIEPGGEGRVAFGDSTWPAITLKERLVAGLSARLLVRAGLVWVVKPIPPDDLPGSPADDQPDPGPRS